MKKLFASLVLSVALVSSAEAQTLTFEGIGDGNTIGSYYNGGAGPNYGISFGSGAFASVSSFASASAPNGCGGGGGFRGQPSGCGAFTMPFDPSVTISRTAGFVSALTFYYVAPDGGPTISIFSGLDGAGTQLATLILGSTPDGELLTACRGTSFCPFAFGSLAFAGTARSIKISGLNNFAFDDMTFIAAGVTPSVVPEPASYALMAFGLSAVGVAARRRRHA